MKVFPFEALAREPHENRVNLKEQDSIQNENRGNTVEEAKGKTKEARRREIEKKRRKIRNPRDNSFHGVLFGTKG